MLSFLPNWATITIYMQLGNVRDCYFGGRFVSHSSRWLIQEKACVVESIAWTRPRQSTRLKRVQGPDMTGPMLIGSKQGHIFEAELQPLDKREERYFKQVYTLPASVDSVAITGLGVERFPDGLRHVVLATTPTRLFQFIGNVSLDSEEVVFGELFRNYDTGASYQELPIGQATSGQLVFWSEFQEDGFPTKLERFAWLTGPGIYTGSIKLQDGEGVIEDAQVIPYPDSETPPHSIALLQFHHLLLWENRVVAINQLNVEEEWNQALPASDRALQLLTDAAKGTFWIVCSGGLWEVIVTEEDRDAWRLYLQKRQYQQALKFARTDAEKSTILSAQGDELFEAKKYLESARVWGDAKRVNFEDVALRFVQVDEKEALCIFLSKRLAKIKGDGMQQVLLTTWLTDLYLEQLEARPEVKQEFVEFLKQYSSVMDLPTIYALLTSHGHADLQLQLAELVGDWNKVISDLMEMENYMKALETLLRLDPRKWSDAWYRHAPLLLATHPLETIAAWIKIGNGLNPKHLIPALLRFQVESPDGKHQAMRYLSYCIDKLHNKDPVIHNYLVGLYVDQAAGGDASGLMSFLRGDPGFAAREVHQTQYDPQYALRLCLDANLVQPCVFLYSQLGRWEDAVTTSLRHNDVEGAMLNADKPTDPSPEEEFEARKRLWLKIARYLVDKNDFHAAMDLLTKSVLKIADILPLFPDFVLIDDFKDDICEALEDYNVSIQDLKKEMDSAQRTDESIRLDVRQLRDRFAVVTLGEECHFCRQPVLSRQFYIFACGHAFHVDCLTDRVIKEVPAWQRQKIMQLQEKIKEGTNLDRFKAQLDDVIAGECYLCGELAIRSIDEPFETDDGIWKI
jgi:hypothetical protein